ncbi:hypothetical protein JW960_25140 [candidate division KSB1 bacterium]|nr:hypothetical protein [candidate division KSB1 bacterium]
MRRPSICFYFSLFSLILLCTRLTGALSDPALSDDRKLSIEKPAKNKINTSAEYFEKQISLQGEQALDLARQLRRISGHPKQAFNVDAFGDVPNSSWFTNRNGKTPMSIDDLIQGPNTSNGPDTSSAWTITRAKLEGVTPGFSIIDSNGESYVIKFDPMDYPELPSGAEVISTKLFYAAGYNTPENYITWFKPEKLKLGDQVNFIDIKGRERYMIRADIDEILKRVPKASNGMIRGLASKYLPGSILGPFRYSGARKDDPNDIVPHEHRRELRSLRILCAWLNHFDTKDGNTLDTYVEENGVHFVKHYLIDFGATLGSASWGPNHRWRGHENDFDPVEIVKTVATLGLYIKPYEKLPLPRYPSVGLFESAEFHPESYKQQVPNPAFENMTSLDGYWAAKIVMSFTDEQLAAVVNQAQYSDPDAASYILKTLIERRDKVGRHYFNLVTPLDNIRIDKTKLYFDDLAIRTRLAFAENTRYHYEVYCNGEFLFEDTMSGSNHSFSLLNRYIMSRFMNMKNDSSAKQFLWTYRIQLQRFNGDQSKWVYVYVLSNQALTKFRLIGVQHDG